ncbi:MAG: aldo/keto reductase [Proteobacteria bacterium]|nr:aldo/keto reductase [Pseudomonadota bacterium]
MLTRPIPSSGEQVPVIGLGTYNSFDKRLNGANRADLTEVLRLFFEGGGTLIDSSPMYGRAEEVVGELLAEMKAHDQSFIATKVWTRGQSAGIAQMNDSLAKLRAPKIGLMQVHNLTDTDTHLETLREWKAEGRIRYVGITHYGISGFNELMRYLKQGGIDFVQFPYSIEVRDAEERLLPLCADLSVATLANRPFEQAGLFRNVRRAPLPGFAADFGISSWGQYFLKYILAHPAMTCVIPATSVPDHMADNLAAGKGPMPTLADQARMAAYLDGL